MRNGTQGRPHEGSTASRLLRVLLLVSVVAGTLLTPHTPAQAAVGTYNNPIPLSGGGFRFQSCPDPTIIRGQTPGDMYWYLYCTTDPRDSTARDTRGALVFLLIPIFRSQNLVDWTYVGDVFQDRPGFVSSNGFLWAPEIQYFNNKYYLYYTASDTNQPGTTTPGGGSAIGVATSNSPVGPWTNSPNFVVEPQAYAGSADGKRWVYDPAIVTDVAMPSRRYLLYGSYKGGIGARLLSADGFSTAPRSEETTITLPERYEGATVKYHDGYYYLFVSATNCCNGPLTGYSVFAGRSASVLGPYLDRDGASFLDARIGGTPVLTQNGNRWVGGGHNTVFTDFAGRDWTFYHAVDRFDPYFTATNGPIPTKRPLQLDPIEWRDGWPSVRGIRGPSDGPQPGPAAQPGDPAILPLERSPEESVVGNVIPGFSDEFDGNALGPQWGWVRQPGNPAWYGVAGGAFRFNTLPGELYVGANTASMLTEPTPAGDYTVETKLSYNLPLTGNYDFLQAGLVIYENDDNYVKLVQVAIAGTRQIEFGKELSPVPTNYPRYGNAVLGPPGATTWLRITKRTQAGEEAYTAFSSLDGVRWQRGATWTHTLGSTAKIGLISMGAPDFTSPVVATFDYVRVYNPVNSTPPNRPAAPQTVNTPAPVPAPRTSVSPRGGAAVNETATATATATVPASLPAPALPTRIATATPLPAPARR